VRRLTACLLVVGLAAAGCSQSQVDANATVVISGRALDAGGAPLAGAKVLLVKDADLGEVVFGAVLAVGSLGTVCLLPDPPALCRKAHRATTGADGTYRFEVKGSDTQGMVGNESTLNVVVADGAGGPSTTVSFVAREEAVGLPDARLWEAGARAEARGGQLRLAYGPLPAGAGSGPSYSAQLYAEGQEAAIWSQPADAGSASVDERVLEDRSGTVAVGASTDLDGGTGAAKVHGHYLSSRVAVRGTAGAPPSRGARCAAVIGPIPGPVHPTSPCGATDGRLEAPAHLESDGTGVATGAVVDLGSRQPVHLVVARGLSGPLVVELSDDGTTFTTVASTSGGGVAVTPAAGSGGRYVRVRGTSGLDESLLGEISVW
jgi:hypothetical protein